MVQAFPTLYPLGRADYLAPGTPHKISAVEYFQHLISYRDGRIANHAGFRYVALNSIQRWSAIDQGTFCISKNGSLKERVAAQLRQMIQATPVLTKQIMFYASKLRSNRAYWWQRGGELIDMVKQEGAPYIFFTLSAADMYLPDLFKAIDPYVNVDQFADALRFKMLAENPQIAAKFSSEQADFLSRALLSKNFECGTFG